MVAVIATFTVTDGQVEAFQTVARALVANVTANEPGAQLYRLVRSKKDPNIFKMMELYVDKEAIKAHGATDYFQAAFAEMKPLLAVDPVIEMLDEVA